MRRDPSAADLHHSDIITYALTRLAGQYAREKQEILRDLRNYRAAESRAAMRLGTQDSHGPDEVVHRRAPSSRPATSKSRDQ